MIWCIGLSGTVTSDAILCDIATEGSFGQFGPEAEYKVITIAHRDLMVNLSQLWG